jgi:anti-sigma factor (TIGR02949 family)
MSESVHPDCREALARLDDYVDRELTPAEQAEVEGHLRACVRCAPHFTFEQGVLDGIRHRLTRIQVPDTLLADILARVQAE